jgi:hypothetical protein
VTLIWTSIPPLDCQAGRVFTRAIEHAFEYRSFRMMLEVLL